MYLETFPEVADRTDSRCSKKKGNALAPALVLTLGTNRVIPLLDLSEHAGANIEWR